MIDLQEVINDSEGRYSFVNCPCCGKKTLNNYWVCTCGWEYDGITDEDIYSQCNESTLRDFRRVLHG